MNNSGAQCIASLNKNKEIDNKLNDLLDVRGKLSENEPGNYDNSL